MQTFLTYLLSSVFDLWKCVVATWRAMSRRYLGNPRTSPFDWTENRSEIAIPAPEGDRRPMDYRERERERNGNAFCVFKSAVVSIKIKKLFKNK